MPATPGNAQSTSTSIILPGSHDQYGIAVLPGTGVQITDLTNRSADVQTSQSAERITFADGTGLLDPTGNAEEAARLYNAAFSRAPDLAGLEYWAGQLDGGTIQLADVAQSFLASAEFQATYGSLSDRDFIGHLYQNVLGRAGEPLGVLYWEQQLTAGESRAQVLLSFSDSAENKGDTAADIGDKDTAEAYRLYQAAFNRTADAGGLSFWTQSLDGGATPQQIAQGFVSSPEFAQTYTGSDPTSYVTQLYQNVLHRTPDPSGEQFWITALKGGASQADVLLGISDSAENRINTAGATHDGWVFLKGGS